MFKYFRDILSLNERFSYNLIGKLRELLVPFFNMFLLKQEKKVHEKVVANVDIVKYNIEQLLVDSEANFNTFSKNLDSTPIIAVADKAIDLEFDVLNKKVKFDDKIDWHLDFNSGFRWNKGILFHKYAQVNVSDNADVKFPRELSRCHHFLYLGQAYLFTKEDKYVQCFKKQVKNWILENPYKKSINWGCSMDIAIRSTNWIFSLNMMKNSSLIDDDFLIEILTSLYLHGRYIFENPEKNRVYNHNHYLSDLAGLIKISLLFEGVNSSEVDKWKTNSIYEFFREIRLQILPSGFTYERSTNYHRLVTELISYTLIILKNNNEEIPRDITFRVYNMFKCIKNYLFRNGEAPIIGDQDNGRYVPFFPNNINKQDYLLNIATLFFKDKSFKINDSLSDILFLFKRDEISWFNELPLANNEQYSQDYPDAGFYILRSDHSYIFINNSGLSHYNEIKGSTHTHSDLLSFTYETNGIPFLIDPGTYVYSSNPNERMKFRSTRMHNTVNLDGYSQNELKANDLWSIKRNAIPECIHWDSDTEQDVYIGKHSGYLRLNDPVEHKREFIFNKRKEVLTISDVLVSKSDHNVESHFHFDQGVNVRLHKNGVICKKMSVEVKISFISESDFKLEIKEDYISKSYNSKLLAPYLVVKYKTLNTTKMTINIENLNH